MEKDYKDDGFHRELKESISRVYSLYTKDPLVMGVLLYKLLEERENTNRLIKTVVRRIEELNKQQPEQQKPTSKEEIKELLSETDQRILSTIKKLGKATAREIAKEMNYKGANAASARLNRLYESGFLKKKRIGKKVYFFFQE